MGWSRGDDLMSAIAPSLIHLNKVDRKRVYQALVMWANEEDWDTQGQAMGIDPALDEVLAEGGYIHA